VKLAASFLLAPWLAFAGPASAQVHIDNPWSRATPPGAQTAAGYMTIRNASANAERLLGASSPASEKVETHVTIRDGDISRMREVKGYDIPAKGAFELKPGGAHLMFVNIRKPFNAGDKVPLTLRFERAGEVKIELRVEPLGGMGEMHGGMDGMPRR
jgi:periplasmic copper chaperone A